MDARPHDPLSLAQRVGQGNQPAKAATATERPSLPPSLVALALRNLQMMPAQRSGIEAA